MAHSFALANRLVGKVTLVVDKKRVDQSRVRLAEVEIGDETGTVSLRARDEQIDLLEDVSRRSGAVVLRNCTLELYQGKHIRLAVTKWGKLSLYPDHVASTPPAPSKMNFDRNFSAIDLSVVASEMVDAQAETVYGRHAKQQSDTPDSGTRPLSSKTAIQGKHQQSQTSSRRVGRERRQSKGKPGCNPASQSHYIGHSSEHMTVATQLNPMRYTGVHHPYPLYDPAMDLRQYHYARHHQEASLAPASAQQLMMQRQYELQQRQLHHMYHGQQERHRAGMSSSQQVQPAGLLLQAAVPPGSFDANDFHVPSYASATSSPILIPVAVPGAHGKSNLRLHTSTPVESEAHDSSPIAQEKQSTQYVSVSPDDSSQMSYGRMNPDATAFAPSYLGAAQCKEQRIVGHVDLLETEA